MTLANRKIVNIQQTPEKKILSKAQKLFNSLIKKIETEKKLLLEWQTTMPEYQRKYDKDYDSIWDIYNAERVEMVQILDIAYENKMFKKAEKQKISHIIVDITANLIAEHGKEDLKELHDKYSDDDFDTLNQESKEVAAEFMKSMMKGFYGIDIGDDIDLSSADKIKAILEEKLKDAKLQDAEKINRRSSQQANRKKTAKQLEKEARQQQEEQSVSQSIREVYRRLTSALHPDREQDPLERERKTGIMQRVNAAYAKKDLLGLLELQMEAEQIDQSHLNNIAEDRLKNFNKILNEQLSELIQENALISQQFKLQLNLPPYMLLTPKTLMKQLQQDIRDLKQELAKLRREIMIFKDAKALKSWLKDFEIPAEPTLFDRDADDDFMFDYYPPWL